MVAFKDPLALDIGYLSSLGSSVVIEIQAHATFSGSQTCSNRYSIQGSDHVLLPTNKKFSHFMSKISFAVITHNAEQQCGLVLRYPSKNRILPPRGNLPPVWKPLY